MLAYLDISQHRGGGGVHALDHQVVHGVVRERVDGAQQQQPRGAARLGGRVSHVGEELRALVAGDEEREEDDGGDRRRVEGETEHVELLAEHAAAGGHHERVAEGRNHAQHDAVGLRAQVGAALVDGDHHAKGDGNQAGHLSHPSAGRCERTDVGEGCGGGCAPGASWGIFAPRGRPPPR